MSLSRGLNAARGAILRHFRSDQGPNVAYPVFMGFYRGMAEGTFIDRKEVTDRVLNVIKHFEKIDHSKVTPSAHFQKDLGLDSLDTVEVVMAFEEEFCIEIPDSEADKISSTDEAIDYIASHPQAK